MVNPEIGPREPEEKTPQQENIEEREQTSEEILAVINEALEKGREVLLIQEISGGTMTNTAIPYSIKEIF